MLKIELIQPRQPYGVLIIGNFLSEITGAHSASEDLAVALKPYFREILTTSSQRYRPLRLFSMVAAVARHRRRYQVAVVNVFSGRAFMWAEITSKILSAMGKKVILALHGGALPQFAMKHPQKVTRLLAGAASVIAPSEYLATAMRPYRPDIQVIPNGIFLDRYSVRTQPSLKRLLWLRAFHEIYNPSMAIDALSRVLEKYADVTLEMVGPDKGDGSLERCRERAREKGVLDKVVFRNAIRKEEVPQALQRGDIFLNTASVDNTPVSVIEAMAAELCVVSTDVGGIPYLLKQGHDALLVRAGDSDQMAAAIETLICAPEEAIAMARRARHTVEGFDFPCVVRKWCSVLESARISGNPAQAAEEECY
ncbi:MAG: glycosyltransferase family 4 protein [Acidobacteriota bacterium]